MSDTNVIVLSGLVGRDAEKKTFNTQTQYKFSLCQNRNYKENGEWVQEPMWFNVIYYSKSNDMKISKGANVVVSGKIMLRKYKNKNDINVEVLEIIADNINFGKESQSDNKGKYAGNSSNADDDEEDIF